jgi:Fe2+ transport system protein FeoA
MNQAASSTEQRPNAGTQTVGAQKEADICVPLGQLGVGTYATIHSHDLDAHDADDLRAMGLRPACRLRICKRGEPCIVSVSTSGCRIAMTRTLASRVLVHPD